MDKEKGDWAWPATNVLHKGWKQERNTENGAYEEQMENREKDKSRNRQESPMDMSRSRFIRI